MLAHNFTIYSVIKNNARLYGGRTALVSGSQKLSHRQLLEKVDGLACGLLSVGVEKGDRIGVLAQNSIEFFILYGAAAKIGAIMLPINWRLNPEEVKYIISDGSPRILFIETQYQSMVAPLIPKLGCIEKCYSMGGSTGDLLSFGQLMESNEDCPKINVSSNDAYIIIHTAAVKGRPRGATLTHQNIITSNLQVMYIWSLNKKDVHIVMVPMFHYAALTIGFSVMQAGGTNIILPKFDVDLAINHIEKDRVTVFCEFPPMLEKLLEKALDKNADISSIRHVVGLDHPEIVKRFEQMTGGIFWTLYGQTETSGFVSFAPYFERPGSAGIPSFVAEVEIEDDYGNRVEGGGSGEIVVRSPLVFKGYWNCEKDNEHNFRGGWHHTGDTGRFDEDGYLWYTGRKAEKELIKPGGENVYPVEVEKVILSHPLVDEAAVIGVPDSQWGEAIKAICVLKKNDSISEHDLIEFVGARIGRFKKPKYVSFVSKLPKTKDGVIDREIVKAKYGKI